MDGTYTFVSKLYDGTLFELTVGEYDFEQNDEFQPNRMTVDGWLFVIEEAKQDTRSYLTLPKPTLQYGRQIIVHEFQLMPVGATLADFKPQKMGGKKKPNGEVSGLTVEEVKAKIAASQS
jgi:hypothetical protein